MSRERLQSCRYGMRLIDPFGIAGGGETNCCRHRQAAGGFDHLKDFLDTTSYQDLNTTHGVAYKLPSASFCTTCTYYVNKAEPTEDSCPPDNDATSLAPASLSSAVRGRRRTMDEMQANVLLAQGYNLQTEAEKLEAKGRWQAAAATWEKSASLLASAATQTGDPAARTVLEHDASESRLRAKGAAAKPDEKKSACFVATAVFGSEDGPHVMALRDFRDVYLARSRAGRLFVNWYYRNGPYLAQLVNSHHRFKNIAKFPLTLFANLAAIALALRRGHDLPRIKDMTGSKK